MTLELTIVLLLLIIVILMFALDRPRMDAVALLAICALPLTGVIDMREAIAGFGDPNIVLIAAMFVIGEGLVRTGVARMLGDWLVKQSGSNTNMLVVLLMIVVCTLGATMSSTAVTAIFIPIVLRVCRTTNTAPGQLMMPLSVAALISGMTTLVATAPNLVINSELVRRGEEGFRFFSFTPFGVPILLIAIAYMLMARRWLPHTSLEQVGSGTPKLTFSDLVDRYKLAGRKHRLRVRHGSSIIGQPLDSLNLRHESGVNLVAIQRKGTLVQPTSKTELQRDDILLVDVIAADANVEAVCAKYQLEALQLTAGPFADSAQEIGMAEVFVPADSELVGKTMLKAGIRTRFGFSVIGLRRGTKALSQGLSNEEIRIGDTMLVIGPWKSIRHVQAIGSRDLVALNLPVEMDEVLPVTGKSLHALAILLCVIVLMVTGVVSNVHAALLGCLLMGMFGCINFESAYGAIDWKTIVLIVGMLPFSIALERTGGVEYASNALLSITASVGNYGLLTALFLMTSLLGMFISNTATAVLMAPVALSVAEHLGASPYPFAMIVALAASAAFMTPVSSPVNTLVLTPGGYSFSDYVKVGVPFAIIVLIFSVIAVPWLLPL